MKNPGIIVMSNGFYFRVKEYESPNKQRTCYDVTITKGAILQKYRGLSDKEVDSLYKVAQIYKGE